MVLTALLMLPVIYYLAVLLLPAHFRLEGVRLNEDGIQAEIHGTPFKVGVLESSGSPNHFKFSKMAASEGLVFHHLLLLCRPPRLYKHIQQGFEIARPSFAPPWAASVV